MSFNNPYHISQSSLTGTKRPLDIETPEGDYLRITPLGAGNEVGRSCIILEFKQKTIMVGICFLFFFFFFFLIFFILVGLWCSSWKTWYGWNSFF